MLIDPKSLGPNAIAIETVGRRRQHLLVCAYANNTNNFSLNLSLMHAAAASRKKKPGRMNYDKEDHASRVR